MFMMMMCMLVTMLLMFLFTMMAQKKIFNKQKEYEFECGFNSISINRIPFSTQFFLLTILFLIFDLEITIIMPISMESSMSFINNINMNTLMLILMMGLMMEWWNGMMEWTK